VYASDEVYSVVYCVEGEYITEIIHNDEEWISFIDKMFMIAEEGRMVTFQCGDGVRNTRTTKEKVVYTTYDRKEAESWAAMMGKKGYSVQIDQDTTTGEYTCTAIR
jgi:pyruvate/2-oxoacid:ferredoxin oxidoreductase alpha subunit